MALFTTPSTESTVPVSSATGQLDVPTSRRQQVAVIGAARRSSSALDRASLPYLLVDTSAAVGSSCFLSASGKLVQTLFSRQGTRSVLWNPPRPGGGAKASHSFGHSLSTTPERRCVPIPNIAPNAPRGDGPDR